MKRVLTMVLLACITSVAQAQKPPANGRELLQRMHDAYAGKWFKTVTFVQKTTMHRPGQPEQIATWYEAMQSPARLRIDFGDLTQGNGVIYTVDSAYVVRGGKLARTAPSGNPFLPFVAGIYTQPLDSTLRQVDAFHFDLNPIRTDTWQGRPVYVVGASSATDTTSNQFWVDQERLVAVRMLVKLNPAPDAKPLDIRLDNYEPVAGGWLATKVTMLDNGTPMQLEEYSDWKGNVDLPAGFFDAAQWATAPHWFKKQ